jgi:hypothetical protein
MDFYIRKNKFVNLIPDMENVPKQAWARRNDKNVKILNDIFNLPIQTSDVEEKLSYENLI